MRFVAGALVTAFCLSMTMVVAMPREGWGRLDAGGWITGLAVIGVTSGIVGLIVALCSVRLGRRRGLRSGRSGQKPFDPTDIIPFL